MKYQVISATAYSFDTAVGELNRKIAAMEVDGWQPYGALVAVTQPNHQCAVMQPMFQTVKAEEVEA